jgi:hypothetical protein
VTATRELNNFGAGDGDFAIFCPKKAKQASKISDDPGLSRATKFCD